MRSDHVESRNSLWSNVIASGVYLVMWAVLDYVGFIFEVAPGISPWYPPHGLSLAFLLQVGLRFWPLLWVGPMINGSLIWLRGEPLALCLLSLCIAGSYGGAAYALKRLGFNPQFSALRDTLIFLGVGVLASAMTATSSMLVFAMMGLIPWSAFGQQALNFGVGDALGVIILGPVLLVWDTPWFGRRRNRRPSPQATSQVAQQPKPSRRVIGYQVAVSMAVICSAPLTWGLLTSPPLYILLIPIIWITLTHNVRGVMCFIVGIDIALVLFLRLTPVSITLVDLQLFMTTLSVVGMIMSNMAQLMRRQTTLLQKTNNELRHANEDLSNFSYALSHDLRGPLRGIDHLARWIMADADNVLPQASRDDLQTLRRRVSRMEALLDSTLAYMRIGRNPSPAERADIDAVVSDVIHLFTLPAGFEIHYSSSLPAMQTPRAPFTLVLRNLVDNALKHHHRSEGLITITARYQSQSHQLEFCVADNGPGIPQESQTTIFEPFQTLESKDVREGSGMGLALTKKIVTQYGGSIWVESSAGKGSQFWFTWPATEMV